MNQTPKDSPEQLKFKAQDLKENGHSIREIAGQVFFLGSKLI
jgi:hypothetical protein